MNPPDATHLTGGCISLTNGASDIGANTPGSTKERMSVGQKEYQDDLIVTDEAAANGCMF